MVVPEPACRRDRDGGAVALVEPGPVAEHRSGHDTPSSGTTASAAVRQRDPRPRILGAVDVGRQSPRSTDPMAVARDLRQRKPSEPGRDSNGKSGTRSAPVRATSPVAGDDRAAGRRLPSRCVEPHCEGARVAALPKSPGEPAVGLEPAAATPALVAPPGARGNRATHRATGGRPSVGAGAWRVRRRPGRVRRRRDSDPGGVARPVPCPRVLGPVQLAGPPGDLAASDPAMRLSRSGGSDNASRARGGNHGSNR